MSLRQYFSFHSRIVLSVCVSVWHLAPKTPLHHQNSLTFDKITRHKTFLYSCPRHVSSLLPPSGETSKYATALVSQRTTSTWRHSLRIEMALRRDNTNRQGVWKFVSSLILPIKRKIKAF
jgi:hypothetical protein